MMNGTITPPTARDFEIYDAIVRRTVSTRKVAEEQQLSQTRVRQIATRVYDWMEQNLKAKDDEGREKEVRMLQHVAADRLEYQYCELMDNWHEKQDPKYLRQATRIALAQARLGVMAGRIECLAADAIEGPLEADVVSVANEIQRRPGDGTRSVPATLAHSPDRDCSPPAPKAPFTLPAAVRRASTSTGGDTVYSTPPGRTSAGAEFDRALLSSSTGPANAAASTAVA
jgi:hypothetical protein